MHGCRRFFHLPALALLLTGSVPGDLRAQQANSLPRGVPEAQGMASAGIEAFVDAISSDPRQEPHSLMVLRHGHVVAEGWWAPYASHLNHGLYSLSKSFTSTAVGLAVAEGKLSVDDKVLSFFPDQRPAHVSDLLAAMRVRDLLTMSTGQAMEPTKDMVRTGDWVSSFLSAPMAKNPGEVFQYNSGATYMLSVLVEKVTGKRVLDYLGEKLFQPLGIAGAAWDTCPRGHNTGGWGLSVPTEALARVGQLYLQKGVWSGAQILPAAWVGEATAKHIQQNLPDKPGRPNETNDWVQGYGYQFWRCIHGAFRGDGAFGQFLVMMPEQDAVVVITGESKNLQGVLDLVWQHLLPAMKEDALPGNPEAAARLREKLKNLALPVPSGTTPPPEFSTSYLLATNALELTSFDLEAQAKGGTLRFKDADATYNIPFSYGRWTRSTTDLPGTPPSLVFRAARKPATPSLTTAAAVWKDARTLEITLRYLETPHHDTLTIHPDGDAVSIRFQNSLGSKDGRPELTGRAN